MAKKEIKKKKPDNVQEQKIYNYLLPAFLLLLILLITTFKISGDDDIFWHLEIGKYVTETKSVPSSDVFSLASKGQEWIPFEWGFDVLAYNIYNITGYTGLSLFRSIIFIFIFYLFIRLSDKLKLNSFVTYIVLLALVLALFERFMVKPQIISYLFTACIVYIFISYSFVKREGSRTIYLLPLIFLLWTNMHMGVLSGIVLFAIFVISEIAAFINPKFLYSTENTVSKNDLRNIIILFIISAAMLLVNPHGIHTYTYVYSHLNMKMMDDVYEWRSPFNSIFSGSMYIYVYYFFLLAAIVSLYHFFKKRMLFTAISLAVFTALSFRSARFSIDFMLIASVYFIIALNGIIAARAKPGFFSHPYLKPVLAVIIFAAVILLPGSTVYKYFNYDRETGFGVQEKDYPAGAVRFLKENNIVTAESRPFNTYGCGGYLIWEIPGAVNFIDSRAVNDDVYFKFKTINNKQPGFEQLFESYNFDYILWSYPKLPWNNTEIKTSILSYLFKNNDKWKLVYWNDDSFVFVKNETRYKDVIDKFEYKFANPYFYIFDKEPLKAATYSDPARVTEEIRRNLKMNPEGVFIQAMAKSFNVKP